MANIDWKSIENYSQKVIYISYKADITKGQDGSIEKPFASVDSAINAPEQLPAYIIEGNKVRGGITNG